MCKLLSSSHKRGDLLLLSTCCMDGAVRSITGDIPLFMSLLVTRTSKVKGSIKMQIMPHEGGLFMYMSARSRDIIRKPAVILRSWSEAKGISTETT